MEGKGNECVPGRTYALGKTPFTLCRLRLETVTKMLRIHVYALCSDNTRTKWQETVILYWE